MNDDLNEYQKEKQLPETKNGIIIKMINNSKWIPLVAVTVLYLTSGLLVILGIIKLFLIITYFIYSPNFLQQIDLIQILAQFIGIIEVYLLAIIFKIFATEIFTIYVVDVMDSSHEHRQSIEELKTELAKTIVLFLAVFLVQKVVLWNDGIQLLYYGIIITLISAVLIAFIIVLQTNIRHLIDNNSNKINRNIDHKTQKPIKKKSNGEVTKLARRLVRNKKSEPANRNVAREH